MEHKSIRYTIRVGIERHKWVVSIHPFGADAVEKVVVGNRLQAVRRAHSMIDTWLSQRRAREV
jgi:hypothetical protein